MQSTGAINKHPVSISVCSPVNSGMIYFLCYIHHKKNKPVSPTDKTAALLKCGSGCNENANEMNYFVIIVCNITGDKV